MIRVLCDGCYQAGIETVLVTPHYAKVKLSDDTAEVLDLCLDKCLPQFERYQTAMGNLAVQSSLEFTKQRKKHEAEFWKWVTSGGAKEEGPRGHSQNGTHESRLAG